jgi:4-diphosphocytidyl-2-C-methyl-D-erythritol kinase
MVVLQVGTDWEVHAPAKLNLHLEILAKRTDGFHELETLMVPVSIYDTLQLTPTSSAEIQLAARWAWGYAPQVMGDLPAAEANLVVKALRSLQAAAGITQGAKVALIKRIPSQAGLGGASADAAAALLAANAAWGLHWTNAELSSLAATLGSDVPFFLYPGAAICRGRGEQIESLGVMPPLPVVVVRPASGLSTPQVFKACSVPAQPIAVEPVVQALRSGAVHQLARCMVNRLQAPAEALSHPIAELRCQFAQTDCLASQMSGSGSSYFGIFRTERQAQRAAQRFRALGWSWVASGVAGGNA